MYLRELHNGKKQCQRPPDERVGRVPDDTSADGQLEVPLCCFL